MSPPLRFLKGKVKHLTTHYRVWSMAQLVVSSWTMLKVLLV